LGSDALPFGGSQLTGAAWHPSPNFGPRRNGLRPELVVIHYTAMKSAQAALDRLCDPDSEVSAHYLVGRDGTLWQMVDEEQRAWHAGAGSWAGQGDVNSRSIGIELCNRGNHPFPAPQMAALEDLLRGVMDRWNIAPQGVIAHSDLAPGRKCDPGPRFDWARLSRQGLAAQLRPGAPSEPDEAAFAGAATAAGYPADVTFKDLLAAVRLRHRPAASGALDAGDMAVAAGLSALCH
jgi:N-acetylmuramoyl-L-alanine amidase